MDIDLEVLKDEIKKMRQKLGTRLPLKIYINCVSEILNMLMNKHNSYECDKIINIIYTLPNLNNIKIGEHYPQLLNVDDKHMVHLSINPILENNNDLLEGLCNIVNNSRDVNILTLITIYNDWKDINCITYHKEDLI